MDRPLARTGAHPLVDSGKNTLRGAGDEMARLVLTAAVMRSVVSWSLFVALIVGCGGTTTSPLGTPDASVDAASTDAGPSDAGPRTCGSTGDGGRCVANGVACGHCEAAGIPDDTECGAGFTCCHAVPFACADAGHDA